MKIIAGLLGGRPIVQPKSRMVRPMSEKVRAALFDVVGPVTGLCVLDVYAGSGAVGFEAASRGAVLVEAIEANTPTAKVISENARSLGLEWGYIMHRVTAETWLASPDQRPPAKRYHVIVLDPPYAKLDAEVAQRFGLYLKDNGVLVVSRSSKLPSPMLKSLELAVEKTYGDTSLSFYKKAN